MPGFNYIAKNTITTTGINSFGFTGIPSSYTDLMIYVSARSTASNYNSNLLMAFNSDYSGTYVNFTYFGPVGNGTTYALTQSGNRNLTWASGLVGVMTGASSTSNSFGITRIYISSYTNNEAGGKAIEWITTNESGINNTGGAMYSGSALYAVNSNITSIDLAVPGVEFAPNSSFTLYGLDRTV